MKDKLNETSTFTVRRGLGLVEEVHIGEYKRRKEF